jgi:glucosamine--fructose-6-phosphate aminotransferase (isomerizing)
MSTNEHGVATLGTTLLEREAGQAPQVIRAQLAANEPLIEELAARLRREPPRAIVTCARGSSDHAATFGRYLLETRLGCLTSSASPSVASVYHARQDLAGTVLLAISQSGASPDLLATADSARQGGALVLALVNAPESPLSQVAHVTVPLLAGPERSIAATKSYLASLAALTHLVARWSGDAALGEALQGLPALLTQALALDWSAAVHALTHAQDLFVVGRGLGLAIAQEAALKLKETCGLHAEAFSAAEVKHGPMAIVGQGFPVLAFAQEDESAPSVTELAQELAERGSRVLLAGAAVPGATVLPSLAAHPVLQPLALVQSFYRMIGSLAGARGRDPDSPPHLRKVTETV